MDLTRSAPADLSPHLTREIRALLRAAFPDPTGADYDYGLSPPELIILAVENGAVIGHLAAYERQVLIGGAPSRLGLIGGVAVTETYRRRGCARALVAEAHAAFADRGIAFSVLFAETPPIYRSSGYVEMRNPTRVVEDGETREFVYRGGMVAELSNQPWPGLTLDLQGPAV